MKKLFLTMILSSAAAICFANFQTDFSNADIPEMKLLRKASVADGVLKIQNGSAASFKLTSETPYKISFRARVLQDHSTKNPGFFSVNLFGVDTEQAAFMFRRKLIESYLYKNKKKKSGFGGIPKCSYELNEWYNFEFTVMKNFVNITMNGKEVAKLKFEGLIPLNRISFGAHSFDWEMDDLSVTSLKEEKPVTVEKPVFSADFNNDLDAVDDKGSVLKPVSASNYRLDPGIEGKGLTVLSGKKGGVVFDLEKPVNSKIGGLMFWVKAPKGGQFFQLTDDKKVGISAMLTNRYTINVARKGDKSLAYLRNAPGHPGDWVLIALTWNPDGASRYYINTQPYLVSFTPGQRMPEFLDADLDSLKQLKFISNPKTEYTIDRVRFFRRTLTNADVYDEYRRFMPIDMVMEKRILSADSPVKIAVQAAPGGYYTKPLPVEKREFSKADVSLEFKLTDSKGNVLLTETKRVNVDSLKEIELTQLTLPSGKYNLSCTVNGAYQRSWSIVAFEQEPAKEISYSDLKVGKSIYSRILTNPEEKDFLKQGSITLSPNGDYLEMGNNKTDRLSFEISFPTEILGKPVALDITWPDDKTRLMGWYMYAHAIGAVRDKLQSGVSAGNEFPNSNKMITTRHIFYPGVSKYLFECRTLAAKMPAAIAKIEIFELPDGLPSLKVRTPEGMSGRPFGFADEDQTFTNNLNADVMNPKSPVFKKITKKYPSDIAFFTEELIRYFQYSGMNTAHLPLWRYNMSYFPLEGQTGNSMYPGMNRGSVDYVIDTFRKANIRLVASMNYQNLPDMSDMDMIDRDFKKEGLETLDRFGDPIVRYLAGRHRGNIAHPEYFEMLTSYLDNPLKRYAKNPGFGGVEFMLSPVAVWASLDYGYDDWTVNKFSQDTGIKVPAKLRDRYGFLTTEKRKEWFEWRADRVTDIIRKMREYINQYNPDLKLYLSLPQDSAISSNAQDQGKMNSKNYVTNGIDIDKIKTVPGVSITITRYPTSYRHNFHWGKAETTGYETLYNLKNDAIKRYLVDGAAGSVFSFHSYFETFVNPLNKQYPCNFENADIKPHSRWYLRELAFAVAAFDALEYVAGGQPLNTIGRDDESREFAQAFRALPAQPFKQIPGLSDPVTARYLQTNNGTYFYAVNLFHENVTVQLDIPKKVSYTDLSSGTKLSGGTIELKPFQLRSFLIPASSVFPAGIRFVSTTSNADTFYKKRIQTLEETASALAKDGLDVSAEKNVIANIKKELAEKHYAEVYRLSFSKAMNQLLLKRKNLSFLLRQQKMIEKGHYAINCGGSSFYDAPNGILYFPDQKFDGKYGYEGRYNSISRDTTGLTGTDLPELFKTEAYNLDRYKFKLPNGTYKIILSMKAGFKPNFLPENYIFTLKSNGKTILAKYDLFKEMKGDFNKPVRLEIPDQNVSDGNLVLAWNHEQKKNTPGSTTVCLANAIEIIKQ